MYYLRLPSLCAGSSAEAAAGGAAARVMARTRNSEFEPNCFLNVEGGFPWRAAEFLSAASSEF